MNFIRSVIIIVSAVACFGCNGGFTRQEKEIIGSSADGIMRLYVVDNESDSLLLRQQAVPLTKKHIRSRYFAILRERMLLTVNDPENPGVGIAAPQVGLSYRLIAVQRFDKPDESFRLYINPEIIYYSGEVRLGREGCLSVPGMAGQVARSHEIVLRYIDEDTLKETVERISGYTAVIFQHEVDHLNGILYTDRITGPAEDDLQQ